MIGRKTSTTSLFADKNHVRSAWGIVQPPMPSVVFIPTPNQGAPIPVDEDSLRFLYENIEMRDVRVYQAPGRRVYSAAPYRIECAVKTCAKNFTVRNVRFSGLPKCTKIVKESPKGTIE